MKKNSTLILFLFIACFNTLAQNTALSFDGTDDYVRVATPYQNFGTTNEITVECWMNLPNTSNPAAGISQAVPGMFEITNGFFLRPVGSSRQISFDVYKGGNISSVTSGALSAGWHHVAAIANAERIAIYIDGVFHADAAATGMPTLSNSELYIGRDIRVYNNYLTGLIDEVRIWNVARTVTQIKQNMFSVSATSTGLVEYYKFNEASGETVTDLSSTGANGTLGIDATETSQNPTKMASPIQSAANGLSFDGTNDYIQVAHNPALHFGTGDMSIEGWMKTTSANTQVAVAGGGGISYWIGSRNGKATFALGGTAADSDVSINDGQWHHIAGVRSAGVIYLYVDGVSQSVSGTSNNGTTAGSGDFALGNAPSLGSFYYAGSLDEVRVWNVARTQSDIQNFMSAGLTGTETGLVALYNFNEGVTSGNNSGLNVLPDYSPTSNNGTLINFALTGTTSNFVAGEPNITPLSVGLTSFAAARQNSAVQLSWSTVNEQNIASFEIERGVNGRTFTAIGSVRAAGNSYNYTFTDAQPLSAVSYYRLKMVSANGKQSYSQVAAVKMNSTARLEVYPNPVADVLQLQTAATGRIDVAIYNTAGLLVKRVSMAAASGITTIPVDVRGFSKGFYLLQLQSATGVETTNFIKQ